MQLHFLSLLGYLLICHVVKSLEGARILVMFPFPFKSIFMTSSVLVQELARRGHEVTMVTSLPLGQNISNYREIVIDKEIFEDAKDWNAVDWAEKSEFATMIERWTSIPKWTEAVLSSEPVKRLISSRDQYDVIMGTFFKHQQGLLALGHRFNAPVIEICPQHLPLLIASFVGNPFSFSYLADLELPYVKSMSFVERLHNTVFGLFTLAGVHWYELPNQEEFTKRIVKYPGSETRPPLRNLIKNVSLVLVSSHYSFHAPVPVAPNVIDIGGFHLRPPKVLPPDLQAFMDSATEGVIFVSFGTNIKAHMMSKEREQKLVGAFETVKQRVLWRWDNLDAAGNSSNIMIQEWLPQQSILAHPNCVLFLTHGGVASLIEAIHFSVPVIGIPFILDQFQNVEYMQQSGIGLKLDIRELSTDKLARVFKTILNSPSFRERVEEQSRLLRDRPESPLERAVFWVEYVIRHKGAHHLKPASVYLPFHEYILLDVVAFIVAALILVSFILWKVSTLIYHTIKGSNQSLQSEKGKYQKKSQ